MLEFTNEIKPKFPPKVQQIWDDCGTHVTSMEAEQGAKEIEESFQEGGSNSHRNPMVKS